jgi:hypothetical protein
MRTVGPGESTLLLLDVVDVLKAHRINYAVIGAFAASLYGGVRATMDADILIAAGVLQGQRLEPAFTEAGLHAKLTRGDLDDPIPGMLRLKDRYDNQVDVLLGLRGLDPQVFSRTVEVPFQGTTLRFIGREDFIAMKAFAGGPLDLFDAERAIAAGGPGSLDLPLVRRLAARFGRSASQSLESVLGLGHQTHGS